MKIEDLINVADIHASRIKLAIEGSRKLFPLSKDKIEELLDTHLMCLELLTSRFAKLQDYIGNKLSTELLKLTGDYSETMTMIDKINSLERLGVIANSQDWQKMREVRNHISHEYPNEPALTAKYLNQTYELAFILLKILENIKQKFSEFGQYAKNS